MITYRIYVFIFSVYVCYQHGKNKEGEYEYRKKGFSTYMCVCVCVTHCQSENFSNTRMRHCFVNVYVCYVVVFNAIYVLLSVLYPPTHLPFEPLLSLPHWVFLTQISWPIVLMPFFSYPRITFFNSVSYA